MTTPTNPSHAVLIAEIADLKAALKDMEKHHSLLVAELKQAQVGHRKILENANAELVNRLTSERQLREAAEEKLAESEKSENALDEKLKSLMPHGTCGCSYDGPDDICFHHSPMLSKAEAENAALRQRVEEIYNLMASFPVWPLGDAPEAYLDMIETWRVQLVRLIALSHPSPVTTEREGKPTPPQAQKANGQEEA